MVSVILVAAVLGVAWGIGYLRRRRDPAPAVDPVRRMEALYDSLYSYVRYAERSGLITRDGALDAFGALLEAERLERAFIAPATVGGLYEGCRDE